MVTVPKTGADSLIAGLVDDLGIPETIDQMVDWDETQCKLSPGQRIKALIINVLTSRSPLYQVEEYYRNRDVENLLGAGVEVCDLKDDTLGRGLDKLYEADPRHVFSTLALKIIDLEEIEFKGVHADTPSWSLYGEYGNVDCDFDITHGYSKDHRPDLKQFIYGLGVNEDSVPILGEAHSGNMDDKTWNRQFIPKLEEYLDKDLLEKVIYVADSALVTKSNLKELRSHGNLKFISRLPNTFALEEKVKIQAWQNNQWQKIGHLVPGKDTACYKLQSFTDAIDEHQYRLVVVHSSKLDGRKLRGFNSRLEKEKRSISAAADKLAKREFPSEDAALEAWNNFLKAHESDYYPLRYTVEKERKRKKRNSPGRPPKDYVPEYEDFYRLKVETGSPNEQAIAKAKDRLSCFVLITNVLDDEELSDQEVLEEYKKQSSVETSFKFIKDPSFVGPIFLERDDRVEAMAYLILIAYLVYAILQRRVRNSCEEHDKPIITAGGVATSTPTAKTILRTVEFAMVKFIDDDGKRVFPDNFQPEIPQQIIEYAGLTLDIYLQVKEEP